MDRLEEAARAVATATGYHYSGSSIRESAADNPRSAHFVAVAKAVLDVADKHAAADATGEAEGEETFVIDEAGNVGTTSQWRRDNEATFNRLLLTAAHADPAEIANWSDEQCRQAEVWAIAASLSASDNDDIRVPQMPAHVRWPTAAEREAPNV